MLSACLFCKTFRNDIGRFAILLDSIEAYNADKIKLFVSVPAEDRRLFTYRFGSDRYTLLSDEDIIQEAGVQSWFSQQIVKLNFWRTGLSNAAFVLDSDFYFIRDFGLSDLLDDDGTPRFVVTKSPLDYRADFRTLVDIVKSGRSPFYSGIERQANTRPMPSLPRWQLRLTHAIDKRRNTPLEQKLCRIQRLFGRNGDRLHFMPGPILAHEPQRLFYENFLLPNRLSYKDIIRYSPWEGNWYGEWLLTQMPNFVRPRPPLFFHFDSDDAIMDARFRGITPEHIARHFHGIAMAARHQQLERF